MEGCRWTEAFVHPRDAFGVLLFLGTRTPVEPSLSPASPTDRLRDEHRVILRALDLLETAAGRPAGGAHVPDAWWAELAAWFADFADRNHHGKEEGALFPAMVKAGVPQEGGPVGVMLAEHAEGRALVRTLAAGSEAERVRAAREYVALLRAHIAKEHDVLFPLADAVLEGPTLRAIGREFDDVETALGRATRTGAAEIELARLGTALGAV
jgi:hemerythrin-like domain-containing protein